MLNAVEAMPDGGDFTISAKQNKTDMIITFQDTGVGIIEENLQKIYDPFFTTKAEGTGLGLSLVYQTIVAHNGNIDISSEPNKGTLVSISLPIDENEYEEIL